MMYITSLEISKTGFETAINILAKYPENLDRDAMERACKRLGELYADEVQKKDYQAQMQAWTTNHCNSLGLTQGILNGGYAINVSPVVYNPNWGNTVSMGPNVGGMITGSQGDITMGHWSTYGQAIAAQDHKEAQPTYTWNFDIHGHIHQGGYQQPIETKPRARKPFAKRPPT
jgi:hypothetical protein